MNPVAMKLHPAWRALSDKEVGWIKAIAERYDWTDEFSRNQHYAYAYELEMIIPTLP